MEETKQNNQTDKCYSGKLLCVNSTQYRELHEVVRNVFFKTWFFGLKTFFTHSMGGKEKVSLGLCLITFVVSVKYDLSL